MLGDARRELRASLRARRRALSGPERARAAELLALNVDRHHLLRAGWRIAVYASLREELDTAPLIALARRRGCKVFLPRIDRNRLSRRMRFVAAKHTNPHKLNRLGILEPQGSHFIGARWLDVVFLPLVGFDRHGLRLGMGGGYYDRAFAFRRWRKAWHAPRLIGLAYSLQEVERITAAPHDVRLDAVITERGVIRCTTG